MVVVMSEFFIVILYTIQNNRRTISRTNMKMQMWCRRIVFIEVIKKAAPITECGTQNSFKTVLK